MHLGSKSKECLRSHIIIQICDLRDSLLTPVVHILIFSTRSVKCVGCFSPAGRTVRTLRAVWWKIIFKSQKGETISYNVIHFSLYPVAVFNIYHLIMRKRCEIQLYNWTNLPVSEVRLKLYEAPLPKWSIPGPLSISQYRSPTGNSNTLNNQNRATAEPGDGYGDGTVRPRALFFASDVW